MVPLEIIHNLEVDFLECSLRTPGLVFGITSCKLKVSRMYHSLNYRILLSWRVFVVRSVLLLYEIRDMRSRVSEVLKLLYQDINGNSHS